MAMMVVKQRRKGAEVRVDAGGATGAYLLVYCSRVLMCYLHDLRVVRQQLQYKMEVNGQRGQERCWASGQNDRGEIGHVAALQPPPWQAAHPH